MGEMVHKVLEGQKPGKEVRLAATKPPCPSGCCEAADWVCCGDNLSCAETAERCPTAGQTWSLVHQDAVHLLAGTAVAREWAPACVPWTLLTVPKLINRKIQLRNAVEKYLNTVQNFRSTAC